MRVEAHLAFAAILFPLLLKVKLAALDVYTLTERDAARLCHLSGFLAHEPMTPIEEGMRLRDGDHPWAKVEFSALESYIARRIHPKINGTG